MSETTALQSVIPMLTYADGEAAMNWLCEVFGFEEKARWLSNGRLDHGELRTPLGGVIMLASPTPDYEAPIIHRQHCETTRKWLQHPWVFNGVLVYISDIDAHFENTRSKGACILSDIERGGPGDRYRCEDLEGQRWMFMAAPVDNRPAQ